MISGSAYDCPTFHYIWLFYVLVSQHSLWFCFSACISYYIVQIVLKPLQHRNSIKEHVIVGHGFKNTTILGLTSSEGSRSVQTDQSLLSK